MIYSMFLKYFGMINDSLQRKKILQDLNNIQIDSADTLFVFSQRAQDYQCKLYLIFAHALAKKGYPSIFLFKNSIINNFFITNKSFFSIYEKIAGFSNNKFRDDEYFPTLCVDGKKINNSLYSKKFNVKTNIDINNNLHDRWKIKFDESIVESRGINFFPLIHNTLIKIFKRYNIDYSNVNVINEANELVKTCDILFYEFQLLKRFSNNCKKKVRIIGWETNYIPNLVFRFLCDQLSQERDIEYMTLQRGYPNYFGLLPGESYVMISNLTRNRKKNRFVFYDYEIKNTIEKYSRDTIFQEFSKHIKKPVEYNQLTKEQKNLINDINKQKHKETKVFCLFSHLFYDTPIDDSSASFENMCDWIGDTVDFFNHGKDILLLKPHPIEINKNKPKKNPNETLKSFLNDNKYSISKNIFLLEPRLFKLNEIVSFFDVGLIWRSSVALELPFYDTLSIIAGNPRYRAINFNYANDKSHYFDMIKNTDKLQVNEKLKIEAASYILTMKDNHKFISIISRDKKINRNSYKKELLDKYIKFGNKDIDFFVDKLLE